MNEFHTEGVYDKNDFSGNRLNFNKWDISAYKGKAYEELNVDVYHDAILLRTNRGWIGFDSNFCLIESSCQERCGICSDLNRFLPTKINHRINGKIHQFPLENFSNVKSELKSSSKEELLFLGNTHRQFGHQITEGLTRTWAIKKQPELAHVDFVMNGLENYKKLQWLVESVGYDLKRQFIPQDKYTCVIKVKKLHVPQHGMRLFGVYNQRMAEVYKSIYKASLEKTSIRDLKPYRYVFLDRRSSKRPCRESALIKSLLLKKGFIIVTSESYSLADEIAIIGSAEYVFGMAGSDMHLTQFNKGGAYCIISHNKFVAPDYYSTSLINKNKVSFVLGEMEPDQKKLEAGFSVFNDSYGEDDFREFLNNFIKE